MQAFRKYPYHRYTLERVRASNLQFERNCRPGTKKDDVDWAENHKLKESRAIQSEYWTEAMMSLFICISKLLLLSSWQKSSGQLMVGEEVTVDPELVLAELWGNHSEPSYWATIVKAGGSHEKSLYTVEDEHGTKHQMQRKFLRHRKWHTVAMIGVTSDRKHDSYATQYFMTEQQKWWEEKYVKTKKEPITRLHVHSDNATHFKSSKSLNFLSRLRQLFLWILAVTWSFGCGGHGKGAWDGIGAVVKRALRQDVVDKKVLSDSGVLKTWIDVTQHLERRFSSEKWREQHRTYKHTVNEFVIQGCESVNRPTYEEQFESIFGIQKSFGYIGLESGSVMQREWDCWCPACFCSIAGPTAHGSRMVNNGSEQGYVVLGCTSQERWFDCTVQRKDAVGVHVR